MQLTVNSSRDRAAGSLIAGLVGDAMGSPSENLEPSEISAQFNWINDFSGSGTDDSFLRHLLCLALRETGGRAQASDWAVQWVAHRDVFWGPMRDRFFVSVLQTLDKLDAGYPASEVARGNMASSSSAMCIAPVGIVNAGRPEVAAAQARSIGSLIHSGDVSFCVEAAAAVAAFVSATFQDESLDQTFQTARRCGLSREHRVDMWALIDQALAMAKRNGDYEAFRSEYHSAMRMPVACDSRETVPAAFALVLLASGDVRTTVEYAANFGRDTDTIGAIGGAMAGAWSGLTELPTTWTEKLGPEVVDQQLALADELLDIALGKLREDSAAVAQAIESLTDSVDAEDEVA